MFPTVFALGALPLALAFPKAMQGLPRPATPLEKRYVEPPTRQPVFLSHRSNTGVEPSTDFDTTDQYVNVGPGSGHEFQAPGPNDLRGECPGLNAAANHGFLPRNGLATVAETVTGLGAAYNMGPDLAGVLAVIAIGLTGDFLTERWSIGGAFPSSIPLLGEPQGILGSHNKYEGDASPCRNDAYLEGGEQVLRMGSFDQLYNLAEEYTLDTLAAHNDYVSQWSELNNPYYFSAPFSGLVTPAAHEFIINFMSNHSAAQPSGYLNRDILKTFFAIEGPDNAHTYNVGMERIPDNWYRRPTSNQYTVPKNLADTGIAALMYPGVVRFGGNTGTTNSFTGVDIGNLTGGVFNSATLFQGNNLGCFAFQAVMAGIPDQFKGLGGTFISQITTLLGGQINPLLASMDCPQLETYNSQLFEKYPGYTKSLGN